MPAAADDVPTAYQFASARGAVPGPDDRLSFSMDGEPYVFMRPKLSIAVSMLQLIDDGETTGRSVAALGVDLTRLLLSILAYVEDVPTGPGQPLRGQARLRQRLDDPRDGLDLPDLVEPFKAMVAVMFNRPTQARPAPSAKPRARASRGSGAGTRSKRAATSTT